MLEFFQRQNLSLDLHIELESKHQLAVSSAKRRLDLFLADKNEEKFRRSVELIQNLTDTDQTQQPQIEITQDIQE